LFEISDDTWKRNAAIATLHQSLGREKKRENWKSRI